MWVSIILLSLPPLIVFLPLLICLFIPLIIFLFIYLSLSLYPLSSPLLFPRNHGGFSAPVLRDTEKPFQRYPPIARYGSLVSQHGQLGAIPPPFSERFPRGEHAKWRCDTPPQKGQTFKRCLTGCPLTGLQLLRSERVLLTL